MGTRAQFFVGDPCDVEHREWLGCLAFDGYPENKEFKPLLKVKTETQYRIALAKIFAQREDFTDPSEHDFPFPWKDDLVLTDCTYSWRDGMVMFNYFHRSPLALSEYLTRDESSDELPNALPSNVPAPRNSKLPPGPDSILIITTERPA